MKKGFTLVELLVVISILGILASIALVSFRSAQMRGRDAQRKSDLKQISSSLELYYSDYGKYPAASSDGLGLIVGCPSTTDTACAWGSGQFWDEKTIYFRTVPKDPVTGQNYYYRSITVNNSAYQGFQLFAHLENSQDINLMPGVAAKNYSCGSKICNFSITSPNTTPTE